MKTQEGRWDIMAEDFERVRYDGSRITLERYDGVDAVPHLRADARAVPMHRHAFYELTLIQRGRCEHFYRGARTPLIPGDLLLIPPGEPHAFSFGAEIAFCDCQFEPGLVRGAPEELLHDLALRESRTPTLLQKRTRDLQVLGQGGGSADEVARLGGEGAAMQGVLHLGRADADAVRELMNAILREQNERRFGFEHMKRNLLEQLLLYVRRAQLQQVERVSRQASWKEDMVDAVLTQIDADLAHDVDFDAIAQRQGITMSYFRMIFKNVTGFSPNEYLNRVRVLRALELLQTTDAPISEIAMRVGVYDANYFSRLFKKTIGYPPRYFKSIAAAPSGAPLAPDDWMG